MAMYVYLCSRVSHDARPLNSRVAESLKKAGFEVYIPHDQKPNNPEDGRFDPAKIWELDFAAMNRANICVVVGRFGKDCSWEQGWFYNKGTPIFHVPAGDSSWSQSPMCIPALTSNKVIENPDTAGEEIKNLLTERTIA